MDYAINLLTNNEKLLFTLATLALTITLTQLIKVWDKKNTYADYYALIAIFIGGIIGYMGGHYLVPAIDDWGAMYGIFAAFIYEKAPDSLKAKFFLVSNANLPYNNTAISADYKHE